MGLANRLKQRGEPSWQTSRAALTIREGIRLFVCVFVWSISMFLLREENPKSLPCAEGLGGPIVGIDGKKKEKAKTPSSQPASLEPKKGAERGKGLRGIFGQ
mmetsp:Transcript_36666/g.55317  ORF Transcript_36666/g.55317 Transcript_36666/m.55317 type:complete len:102 (+) Transcript_36666:56-361(+)